MVAKTLSTLAVATLVVLAGCTGFAPGQGQSPTADETLADGETEATAEEGTEAMSESGDATSTGVVQFYLSDEKNAIGDFEHLNVTITKVGFQRADAEDEREEEETDRDDETPENGTGTTTETDVTTAENVTATPTESPAPTESEEGEGDDGEMEGESEDEEMEREDGEAGGWTEYDVESRTVDLTRLQGDNATLLSEFDVPEGSYTKVFVHVSEVEGTLENGESVNVKLPSEKLQLTTGFTVEANESIDFVFDITVFKAGNSGKYILKPVISESGTDVPIRDVDEEQDDGERGDEEGDDQRRDGENRSDEEREDRDNEEREDRNRDAQSSLNASFVGAVEPGANATVRVTSNGSAVANATVYVDGEPVGVTGDGGELTFLVPADAEAVEVKIESGDAETELEAEFEGREESEETDGSGGDENSGNGDGGGGQGQ